jgi:catechol 2,3-dioxygenase-like lactoylglutathione lyase family enzyme
MNLNQVTLPAIDIAASALFYRRMGFTQIVDAPHYARFECPEGDATFSVHRVESFPANTGVVLYFECQDLDGRVAELQDKGFQFVSTPADQRWLWREARLHDPAGNTLCLFTAGSNRKSPPWRVNLRELNLRE